MKKLMPVFLFTILSSAVFNASAAVSEQSLECTEEEIGAYIDKSGFKKGSGFNTIPTTDEFIKAAIEKKKIEEGDNADDCITIFDEGISMQGVKDKFKGIMDIINDPMGGLSKAGSMAKDRMTQIYNETSEQVSKDICDRLSKDTVSGATGDQIDKIYKEQTKDSVLQGTSVDSEELFKNGGGIGGGQQTKDPSDAFGKNFTYQIIKNQVGKNSSSIARILDISNPNQAGVIGKETGKILDSTLDKIESSIFGD